MLYVVRRPILCPFDLERPSDAQNGNVSRTYTDGCSDMAVTASDSFVTVKRRVSGLLKNVQHNDLCNTFGSIYFVGF